jgi:hypothetical protein
VPFGTVLFRFQVRVRLGTRPSPKRNTPKRAPPTASLGTLHEPTAQTPQLSSTILSKASRSATEEGDSENDTTIIGCFVLGRRCFIAKTFCDGQYFYWAISFLFGNKHEGKWL